MRAIDKVVAFVAVVACLNACGHFRQAEHEDALALLTVSEVRAIWKLRDGYRKGLFSLNRSGLDLGAARDKTELPELIARLEAYLALNPDWKNGDAWMGRAIAHGRMGNSNPLDAIMAYAGGVEMAMVGQRSKTLKRQLYSKAITHYEDAERLDPMFPWSANNLAWLLATCPEESLRDGRRSVELARRAMAVPRVEVPDFVNTLAAAHAANGDFDAAVRLCRRSIEMWPRDQFKEMLRSFEDRAVYINRARPPEESDFMSVEGCGNARWGMNKLEVMAVSPDPTMKSNDVVLSRWESPKGYRVSTTMRFRYDMLYRVEVVATGISLEDIETDFIRDTSNGTGRAKTSESAADGDRTAATWESNETRIETVYRRSKGEAVMDFVSKRYERLSIETPAKRQPSMAGGEP
jgi:hypothetical protein